MDYSKIKFNVSPDVKEELPDKLGISSEEYDSISDLAEEIVDALSFHTRNSARPSDSILKAKAVIEKLNPSADAMLIVLHILNHAGLRLRDDAKNYKRGLLLSLKSLAKYDKKAALTGALIAAHGPEVFREIPDLDSIKGVKTIGDGDLPEDCAKCDKTDCPVKEFAGKTEIPN